MQTETQIIEALQIISNDFQRFDFSFLPFLSIQDIVFQISNFLHLNLYLPSILDLLNSLTFQSPNVISQFFGLNNDLISFLIVSFNNTGHHCILNSISKISLISSEMRNEIISLIFSHGGFQSILKVIQKVGINEENISVYSHFLMNMSLSLYPTVVFYEDLFECLDCLIQSSYHSVLAVISHILKNILYHISQPSDILNQEQISQIFESISNHLLIENLYLNIDNDPETTKYTLIVLGLFRYHCDISDLIDINMILDYINSTDIDIIICSSRCFSDFCIVDGDFGSKMFSLEYFYRLIEIYHSLSFDRKLDFVFQIVTLASIAPVDQLFLLCKNETATHNDNLLAVFSEIVNTKSVILLDKLLRVILNIINYSDSINELDSLDLEPFLIAIHDIQNSDTFEELAHTDIPSLFTMIQSFFNTES